jgi:hypothetical protein
MKVILMQINKQKGEGGEGKSRAGHKHPATAPPEKG